MEYSTGQSLVTDQTKKGVHITTSNSVKFHGFNIPCLRNPKACPGSFQLKFVLSFTGETNDGIVFSTSGSNTSISGTSLFLKNSNLIASIRTESRIWEVSAPTNMVVDAFEVVKINWGYNEDISLQLGSNTFTRNYLSVSQLPTSDEDSNGFLSVGGIDIWLNWMSFKVEDYDEEWRKKIHHGGNDRYHRRYCDIPSFLNHRLYQHYRRVTIIIIAIIITIFDAFLFLFPQLMVGTQNGNHGVTVLNHVVTLVCSIVIGDAQTLLRSLMD